MAEQLAIGNRQSAIPLCPCGRESAGTVVCPDCWAHADRVLRARCQCPHPGLKRLALRDLKHFAASRRDAVRQPVLNLTT